MMTMTLERGADVMKIYDERICLYSMWLNEIFIIVRFMWLNLYLVSFDERFAIS